jgi:hypothetical protein
MSAITLARADVSELEVFANDRDLLQDLASYLDYVQTHTIKRMFRTNQIPKADMQRIARLLGDRQIEQAVKETGTDRWIAFIDQLAREMGLVSYDIEGEFVGYSSAAPSFYNNIILLNEKDWQDFLAASPAHQEKRILNALVDFKGMQGFLPPNEFYQQSLVGRLDTFSPYGSAMGVMPTLDFPAVRRFLLELLSGCEAGGWYSTSSLVDYLKANHPTFLIPQKLSPDHWGKIPERYSNFRDGPNRWSDRHVPTDAPDAFERVEGRYIERFLEGIPLVLRFVELAYPLQPYEGLYPMMSQVPAFRLSERFTRLMKGQIEPPRVSLLPNFDVIVESEIYPLNLMRQLERLAERVSAPTSSMHALVITLQLKKERIAAELARNPNLDAAALLREWSQRALPVNVLAELEAWSGHAEQFILYQGFGLLESTEALPQARHYSVEAVGPGLQLVRQPAELFQDLEAAALVPLMAHHLHRIQPLPAGAHTCFPQEIPAAEPAGPQLLEIERSTLVRLHFPSEESFEDFRNALSEARCPIQVDVPARLIQYAQQHQPIFDRIQEQLAGKYQVRIEDLL